MKSTKNPITGDAIKSRAQTKEYSDGFEGIKWGVRKGTKSKATQTHLNKKTEAKRTGKFYED